MTKTATIPTFGLPHRLARAMEVAEKTRGQMAAALKVSPNTITNYVHGNTRPLPALVDLWADACQVDRSWLATGEPDPNLRTGSRSTVPRRYRVPTAA